MWLVTDLSYLVLVVLTTGVNGDGHPNIGLLPEECGFIDGERMPDSKYARLYEFPWMASISHFAPDGGRHAVCSGTVISERYILTTGHCGNKQLKSPISQVRVGDYDYQHDVDCEGQGPKLLCEDQFQEIDIEEVIVHENISMNKRAPANDIALVRLKTPIDFSRKNSAPVCLPLTTELQKQTLIGKEAIVAGWELMINGATTTKMLKLNIPIREPRECPIYLNSTSASEGTVADICTGGVEGICPLYSGSPLMLPSAIKEDGYRYVQYGIIYRGTMRCDSEQWTLYVDVTKHMDWILNNLKA